MQPKVRRALDRVAKKLDLSAEDRAVIEGMITAETRGRHTTKRGDIIKSPVGAIGAMQLMPKTAAGLGVDPADLDQNIEGGVRYFLQLKNQFQGTQDPTFAAVAAYNWGPSRVKRALEKGGGVLKYENLHREPKKYVMRVSQVAGRPLPESMEAPSVDEAGLAPLSNQALENLTVNPQATPTAEPTGAQEPAQAASPVLAQAEELAQRYISDAEARRAPDREVESPEARRARIRRRALASMAPAEPMAVPQDRGLSLSELREQRLERQMGGATPGQVMFENAVTVGGLLDAPFSAVAAAVQGGEAPYSQRYAEMLEARRARAAGAAEQAPVGSFLSNTIPQLVPAAGIARGLAPAMGGAAALTGLRALAGPRALMLGTSAAEGALFNASQSQGLVDGDVGQVAKDAATGAGAGAVLGGGALAAGRAMQLGTRVTRDAMGRVPDPRPTGATPGDRVQQQFGEWLERRGEPPPPRSGGGGGNVNIRLPATGTPGVADSGFRLPFFGGLVAGPEGAVGGAALNFLRPRFNRTFGRVGGNLRRAAEARGGLEPVEARLARDVFERGDTVVDALPEGLGRGLVDADEVDAVPQAWIDSMEGVTNVDDLPYGAMVGALRRAGLSEDGLPLGLARGRRRGGGAPPPPLPPPLPSSAPRQPPPPPRPPGPENGAGGEASFVQPTNTRDTMLYEPPLPDGDLTAPGRRGSAPPPPPPPSPRVSQDAMISEPPLPEDLTAPGRRGSPPPPPASLDDLSASYAEGVAPLTGASIRDASEAAAKDALSQPAAARPKVNITRQPLGPDEGGENYFAVIAADEAGTPVGRIEIIRVGPDTFTVLGGEVAEEFRGMGIGSEMYEDALRLAGQNNVWLRPDHNISESERALWHKISRRPDVTAMDTGTEHGARALNNLDRPGMKPPPGLSEAETPWTRGNSPWLYKKYRIDP